MLTNYIAAGFDPARFWDITPRLFAAEMAGAERRIQMRRSEVWATAMLPHFKEPMSHDAFVFVDGGNKSDIAAALAAWDKIDRAFMASKPKPKEA